MLLLSLAEIFFFSSFDFFLSLILKTRIQMYSCWRPKPNKTFKNCLERDKWNERCREKYGDGNMSLLQELWVCERRNCGMSMEYGYCVNTSESLNSQIFQTRNTVFPYGLKSAFSSHFSELHRLNQKCKCKHYIYPQKKKECLWRALVFAVSDTKIRFRHPIVFYSSTLHQTILTRTLAVTNDYYVAISKQRT